MVRKRMELVILSALLCALTVFGLGGCRPEDTDPDAPNAGGTTDRTDYDAPKEIKSKDISSFYATFYLVGEWRPGFEGGQLTLEIREDDEGKLRADVTDDADSFSAPTDDALLSSVQAVIDAYDLVQQNGIYRVTAGLPPEFQQCTLTAQYESGEYLTFTTNNDPDALWSKQLYLAFANWFASVRGDDSLLPPKRTDKVVKLRYHFKEDGLLVEFGGINVPEENAINGETYLLEKDIYDTEKEETLEWEFILFPEDYYEKINEIIARHDLRAFDRYSVYYWMDPPEEADEPYLADLQLHIEYENGQNLYIDTSSAEAIEKLRPLLADLVTYYDTLF